MEIYDKVYSLFWTESFWLPPNVTWADFARNETTFIPQPRDLWVPFPLAVGLFLLRLIWERIIALPLGRYYNIKESPPRPPVPNEILEKAFKQSKVLPDHTKLKELSKKSDLETRQIERWWRKRRVMHKPSEMTRWKETSWRFIFYLVAFWYGVYILYEKPWFWDTRYCWYDYPRQNVTDDVYWYYMVELGFYWSLILSLFMDVKRKDFYEMIVHHIATILLLTLSYAENFARVGALVLVIHDAVDYWMEGAKLVKYARYHRLCDAMFVIFAVMWFVTRLVIFPIRLVKPCWWDGPAILKGYYPSYLFMACLLIVLQCLHIFWFSLIMAMVKSYIIDGSVEKDERSETEPESSEEESEPDDDIRKKVNNNIGDSAKLNGDKASSQSAGVKSTSRIPVKSSSYS